MCIFMDLIFCIYGVKNGSNRKQRAEIFVSSLCAVYVCGGGYRRARYYSQWEAAQAKQKSARQARLEMKRTTFDIINCAMQRNEAQGKKICLLMHTLV